MRMGLDYASGRPGGAAIRETGYDFVVRYLSSGGAGLPGKLLTPEEAEDLRAHGVSIVSNWETYANRLVEGYDAGAYDARRALDQVLACGGRRDRPIYFSADWDTTEADQDGIHAYLDGAASVIGRENVGIYGGYWSVSRALDAGKAAWAWQTLAWSGSNLDPRRKLHQRIHQVEVGGVWCDENEALTEDFGQWDYVRSEEQQDMDPELVALLRDIQEQLRGPGLAGWPQLGANDRGQNLTLVDGLAEALARVARIEARLDDLLELIGEPEDKK